VLGEDHVILDHVFTGLEKTDEKVTVHFQRMSNKEKLPSVTCDFLIGCDGLKSPVRASLLGEHMPRYTGRTIYRGLCEVDEVHGDGSTVALCGDELSNFICYPISESLRKKGKFHCNWGYVARRPEPAGAESWTALAKVDDIREELSRFGDNKFGGLTPLQIAEKTEKIIGWALFDRDPIDSFNFGNVTLLGDAAHPLLPYGSQGATQAIMDAEAIGVCYQEAMVAGTGVKGCVQLYSDMRCEVSAKVVIANRDMGATAVLRVAKEKCEGKTKEEKVAWCKENGVKLYTDVISTYRNSMPKSVRPEKRIKT
jgi:2-polyprenyl-6-methoxyphenol hydroxylase-like FAD-dependent oxidoreductase